MIFMQVKSLESRVSSLSLKTPFEKVISSQHTCSYCCSVMIKTVPNMTKNKTRCTFTEVTYESLLFTPPYATGLHYKPDWRNWTSSNQHCHTVRRSGSTAQWQPAANTLTPISTIASSQLALPGADTQGYSVHHTNITIEGEVGGF